MMQAQSYDKRPTFARWLWRDCTQEHWAFSLAVDALAMIMFWSIVGSLAYLTAGWWAPRVFSALCGVDSP